jgi:hypothetical protein
MSKTVYYVLPGTGVSILKSQENDWRRHITRKRLALKKIVRDGDLCMFAQGDWLVYVDSWDVSTSEKKWKPLGSCQTPEQALETSSKPSVNKRHKRLRKNSKKPKREYAAKIPEIKLKK